MKRQHFSDTSLQTTLPILQHGIIAMRIHGVVHTNVPHLVVHHSPTGFDFGYAGSGPADLALNILEWQLQRTHFQGPRLPCWEGTCFRAAWAMHQPFKQDFLAQDRHVIRVSLHTLDAWVLQHIRPR